MNAAPNLEDPYRFPWVHWLSSPLTGNMPRAERAVMPFQNYTWTMLNKSTPWSATFVSSGLYSRFLVRFSLSGLPEEGYLKIYLDGEDLGWKPHPGVGLDRWHYDIYRPEALSNGNHEIKFILGDVAVEGAAQLCSVEIIEYGNENEYVFSLQRCMRILIFQITDSIQQLDIMGHILHSRLGIQPPIAQLMNNV